MIRKKEKIVPFPIFLSFIFPYTHECHVCSDISFLFFAVVSKTFNIPLKVKERHDVTPLLLQYDLFVAPGSNVYFTLKVKYLTSAYMLIML